MRRILRPAVGPAVRATLVAVVTVGLTGCGMFADPSPVTETVPVPHPYDGPMQLERKPGDRATVLERSGAAGRALECDYPPYAGGGSDYGDGLESVQGSAASALSSWLHEEFARLPDSGYHLEREADHRALLSFDVGERTKIAVIAADGVTDSEGHVGWGVESWAQCDPAELPATYDEALGVDVWEDAAGQRVPASQVYSFTGPEHCDWQDITFLLVGPDPKPHEYLRDTTGELHAGLRSSYADDVAVPDSAASTGYRHDGRELWLEPGDPDAAYLVAVDDPTDVERWPAAKDQVLCA